MLLWYNKLRILTMGTDKIKTVAGQGVLVVLLVGCAANLFGDARQNIFVNPDLARTDGVGAAFGWETFSEHGAWLCGKAEADGVVRLPPDEYEQRSKDIETYRKLLY